MAMHRYDEPVVQLLTLGDVRGRDAWRDYRALGLTQEHVPELIRMAVDEALYFADSESDEVWASIHAWRALAQLRAEAAIEPLIEILYRVDMYEDDWVDEELPEVLGMIGPAAIFPLAKYVVSDTYGRWARLAAAHAILEIAERHPEVRGECVAALRAALARYRANAPEFNGFIISYLIGLDAVEVAPLMERAFNAGAVDLVIVGNWEDVQIELGLIEAHNAPKPTDDLYSDTFSSSSAEATDSLLDKARRRVREIGRNDPCWCGSGKKYKHCHLREDQAEARR